MAVTQALARSTRHERSAAFWNPGFIPVLPGIAKSMVTVHDLIHLHFYSMAHRTYYNTIFRPLYRRCDRILCISEFTRVEFLEWSGMAADRVIVVPNGIEPDFPDLAVAKVMPRPFVFYAGNRRKYKNVPLLVQSFFMAGLHRKGFDLLLTGAPEAFLQAIAESHSAGRHLQFLGFLSDQELVSYYKAATAVAFLSQYEGFGLPILEAMACNVPLVLADATALPEVAGDAALYVEPTRLDSVVAGLGRICDDESLRIELVEKGRRRLRDYSLDGSARLLWQTFRDVASS
jgi:glycosyltransferase involved in cell wall biosynthesis